MKKMSLLVVVILLASMLAFPVYASESSSESDAVIETYEDGSYMVITMHEEIVSRATNTVKKTKKASYYSIFDELLWAYAITGTFEYDGSTATCTKVTDSLTIYNSSWSCTSRSTSKSGNKAYGNITMIAKQLDITIDTETKSLTLTCTASGVVS